MRPLIKTVMLAALFILSACSAQQIATQKYTSAVFPFRHSDFDYKIAWKTTEANNVVVIDGIVKNVRYSYIDSINLTVFLLGPDGKIRTRATTVPAPQQTMKDDVVPFTVELHNVSLKPGDTLKFTIHYGGGDGGMDGGVDSLSTFGVDAMTGAVLHKDNLKPEEW
jgi:hypothetical protein